MMNSTFSLIAQARTAFLAGLAFIAACGAAVLPAAAQSTAPAGASAAPLPSYASNEERIRGRIASFDGKYQLQLRDERGFVDSVTLHDGTIINPTGLRLSPGQSVTVVGHNTGKTFQANEIDTPYAHYGYPVYGYAYPAYAYGPYPYYPYGYYPAFGLGFRSRGFGVRGWF